MPICYLLLNLPLCPPLNSCKFIMARLLLPVAALVASVYAQIPVENNPNGTPNLLVNGNFTAGTTGWKVQGKTWSV